MSRGGRNLKHIYTHTHTYSHIWKRLEIYSRGRNYCLIFKVFFLSHHTVFVHPKSKNLLTHVYGQDVESSIYSGADSM